MKVQGSRRFLHRKEGMKRVGPCTMPLLSSKNRGEGGREKEREKGGGEREKGRKGVRGR